ncbi:hypothetical protein [Streptomyces albogriseolus]|uniref:hypothetical protein n=1 Tax=Streptomyces albogriseolus TaxID=1887 RepID=UPI00346174E2
MGTQISRRKTPWPVRVVEYMSRAVTTTAAWTVGADGRLTEFGKRNARWVALLPREEQCPTWVKLTLVHEGRELYAELSGEEAVELGRTLVRRGEEAIRRNVPRDPGARV